MAIFVLLLILLGGIALYFVKPHYFFLYWLSIQPYVLPFFYVIFKSSFTPVYDNFLPLYFGFSGKMSILILLLFCFSWVGNSKSRKTIRVLFLPLASIFFFFIIQNFFVGLNLVVLYRNIMGVFFSISPFFLLILDRKIRPKRDSFIRYIIVFVFIQLFFSILNIIGFRIYGEIAGGTDIEDVLICGTFTRYNHMANYLSVFYFIISHEYYKCRTIKPIVYYCVSFLIGLLIVLSGSRMTLVLLSFTFLFFFCFFHTKKIVLIALIIVGSLFSAYIIGNDSFSGKNANDLTGLDRNMLGIIDLANSDDLSEGSTLAWSAYLLLYRFDSPILGNGRAYRNDRFYGDPSDPNYNEGIYMTDARLAFMLVEYGFLGLTLFLLLYISVFNGCYIYSSENSTILYWGAGLYFILFSITDNGFWDQIIFPIILIYAFSRKKKVENEYDYVLKRGIKCVVSAK